MNTLPYLAVAGLAAVHVASPALTVLDRVPRSRWLSFGGGVAVTLVFLEILPELAESQERVDASVAGVLAALDRHIYLLALVALTVFYGVERRVKATRAASGAADVSSEASFWLKLSVVAVKNVIVAYLLVREDRQVLQLALFFAAVALELTLSDRGMHDDHKQSYDGAGRWLLVAALVTGGVLGAATRVPDLALAALSAVLAGFIVLNVFSEELPPERQSSVGAFISGVAVFAALQLGV